MAASGEFSCGVPVSEVSLDNYRRYRSNANLPSTHRPCTYHTGPIFMFPNGGDCYLSRQAETEACKFYKLNSNTNGTLVSPTMLTPYRVTTKGIGLPGAFSFRNDQFAESVKRSGFRFSP